MIGDLKIQNVDEKIFTKYGVNLDSIASSTDLDAQRFFIGYQVRVFDDVRLIELKFNKEKIEEYFLENSIPFLANTSDVKIYIAINDAFLPMNNTLVYESGEFQKELEQLSHKKEMPRIEVAPAKKPILKQ